MRPDPRAQGEPFPLPAGQSLTTPRAQSPGPPTLRLSSGNCRPSPSPEGIWPKTPLCSRNPPLPSLPELLLPGAHGAGPGVGRMMPAGHARVSPGGEWVFKVNPKSASRRAAPARSLLALSVIDVILPPISRAAAASPLQFPKSLGADRTRSSNTGLELLPEPSPRVGAQGGEGEAAALPSRA